MRYVVMYDPNLELTIWTTSPVGFGNYYYKCRQAPQGFGPFNNEQAARKHYNSLIKSITVPQLALISTVPPKYTPCVIHVDFKNKRRMG
jgi:hypothetical protein